MASRTRMVEQRLPPKYSLSENNEFSGEAKNRFVGLSKRLRAYSNKFPTKPAARPHWRITGCQA